LAFSLPDPSLGQLDLRARNASFRHDSVAWRPKSRSGRRTVPVPAALRKHLLEHRLARGRLFFGRPNGRPFSNQSLSQRAARHWRNAGLEPIGLHECRHTFASLMIAAGVNAKALSTFLGHASVTITLDR
jgi:integrase